MRFLYCFVLLFITISCIPVRIAPNISEYKIVKANKFKRKLPKQYAFVFEDPKEANEFYNYINTKFQLNHQFVDWDVPFKINNHFHYLRFYETEIPNKTFNLIPFLIDAKRESNGNDSLLEDAYISRKENWYLVITVNSDESTDCLNPNYQYNKQIIIYLKELRQEYINTQEYSEVLLKQKSPN